MKRSAEPTESDFMTQIARLQTTNNDYKLRISELEKDISTLMSTKSIDQQEVMKYLEKQHFIDELQSELRDSQQELSELRAMFAAQNSALLSTEDISSELLEQKNKVAVDITKRFAEQQKGLAEFKARNSELEKQLAMANADNAQLVVENCELRKQIRELTGNESIQGAERSRLQGTVEDIHKQLQIQIKTNEKNAKVIQTLQAEIATSKTNYEKLQIDYEKVMASNSEMNVTIGNLQRNLEQAKAEVERLTKDNERCNRQIREKQNKLDEQKLDVEKATGRITKYKEQISALKNETSLCEQKRIDYESQLSEARLNLERVQAELEDQKRINKDIRDEKTEIEVELNDLRATNDHLSFTIEEKRQENTDAEKKTQDFKTKIKSLKSELQTAKMAAQKSVSLEGELQRKQQALDNLRQKYNHLSQQNQTLTYQLQEMRNQSISIQSRVEQSQHEKERVHGTVKRLQANQARTLQIARSSIKKTQQKCVSLCKYLQNEYLARLELMNTKIESVATSVAAMSGIIAQKQAISSGFSEERMRFLRQIENHLRIIDKITRASAGALNLQTVPYPTDLINSPEVLQEFLHIIRGSKKKGCHHTRSEVTSFIRKANL